MTVDLPIVLPLTAPLAHRGYAPDLSGQGGGVPAGLARLTALDEDGQIRTMTALDDGGSIQPMLVLKESI